MAEPAKGTVEDLLEKVDKIPGGTKSFALWIPNDLTMQGKPVTQNLAMTVLLDKLLGKNLFPDGFEERQNGRLYKYKSEP